MKKGILLGLLAVLLTACGGNTQKSNQSASETTEGLGTTETTRISEASNASTTAETTTTTETTETTTTKTTDAEANLTEASMVHVYYFHGKQRCKTCIAVGDVTEKTIADFYTDNPQVKFIEVKTHEKQNASLVEKYEVTWNALIIAKDNDHIEITKEAFANALESPEKLTALINTEVAKRLVQ